MNIFFYYFIISGVITFLWFYYIYNFSEVKEEANDDIADMTWNTGVGREWIKLLIYSLALILGWFILPYEILNSILKWED